MKNIFVLLSLLYVCPCMGTPTVYETPDVYNKIKITNSRNDAPPAPENVAEMARYIMHKSNWAAMATVSVRKPTVGQPFSNVFSVSDGAKDISSGVPYMYLTDMEMSCQDLAVNPHASLSMTLAETSYCYKQDYDPQSPLCPRLIINGKVLPVKKESKEEQFAKWALFTRHPEMRDWPDNHGFYVGKLNITSVCVLDHFGGPQYVSVEDYFNVKL